MPGSRDEIRWGNLLRGLYDDRETAWLMRRLDALVEDRRRSAPGANRRKAELTQRDVMLIVYPDQIVQAGSAPLSVLADFCLNRLAGVVSLVHILPFFPSSSDDGFAVTDYRRVDPALGSWDDIHRLAHKFQLMIDAVVNHASARGEWFQAFLRDEAPYRGFFLEQPDRPELARVVRPRTTPLLHSFPGSASSKIVWTTFSADQVDLNYRNPRLLLKMVELLLEYSAHGASFLRLDAVAYLWKEVGTACIHLPQTHRIVRLFRSVLESAAPGVKLVTETNVPQAENLSYFGDGNNEAHLVYNFPLPPLVLHTLHSGSPRALSRWIDGLPHPGGRSTFLNFLASHDGIGLNAVRDLLPPEDLDHLIRKTLEHGGRISDKRNSDGTVQPYELNINYLDAVSAPDGGEPLDLAVGRFLAAHGILLALAGIPAIYFHSLFGSRGWPDGVEQTGRNRTINRQKLERAELERGLSDKAGLRHRVFTGLQRLIRARMLSPAFDPYGRQQTVDVGSAVFALQRTQPGSGRRALCLQEVSGEPQTVNLDLEDCFGASGPAFAVVDLVTGKRFSARRDAAFPLGPYQTCWLVPLGGGMPPNLERASSA
ncbi:MAG: sugar phosphorylase [Anaerolineales bacterium]|nr:sugar phosphorylase [Anaerolineales bacterium]